MEDLINNIVAKLGIDATTAEKVVGIIMNLFKENAPAESFGQLTNAIPGADDLMARFEGGEMGGTAEPAGSAGGGLMGAAMGMLGGMGGGNPVMDTLAKLQAEGVTMDQAKGAGVEIVSYAREQAGDDTVNAVLESVPGLKDML